LQFSPLSFYQTLEDIETISDRDLYRNNKGLHGTLQICKVLLEYKCMNYKV
jgi:hypothetical protein